MLPSTFRRVLAALFASVVITTALSASTTTTAHAAGSPSCADEKAARNDARNLRTDAVHARSVARQDWLDARAAYQADRATANREAMEEARVHLDDATATRNNARTAFIDARTDVMNCLDPYRFLFTDRVYNPNFGAGGVITVTGLSPGQVVFFEFPDWCGEGCGDFFVADGSGSATTDYEWGVTSCPATRQPRVRVYDGSTPSAELLKEQVLTADVCSDDWAAGSGESP